MSSKKIIITGASRGIGFELVRLFLKQGHHVLGISRNIKTLKELLVKNKNLNVLKLDISEESENSKISNFLTDKWGGVDILIHNAGKLILKPFDKTNTQDFLEVYKVNVFAVAALTKTVLPFLTSGSHVIAISSMGGIQGSMKFAGLAAYSSSKGAVITLIELLAEEYKEKNIAFNTLALGAVQTEMLAEAFPDYKAPVSASEMAEYISEFALTGNKYYNGKVLQVSASTP
ncbi:MAG: SDR family oxidoreductase [Aureibaculum sp.]